MACNIPPPLKVDGRENESYTQRKRTYVLEEYRSSTWFIVTSVIIANFTDLFIYSAIVPVAPFALPTRAGIPSDDVQYWISIMLAIFNVFSITTSLPSGWICDRLGIRRPMFVVGTTIQFVGLILLTIGKSIPMWLFGRALQGISCAIVLTTTLPLLLEAAPKEQSGRYLGLFSMSASAALISGPLIGGMLYDRCGYYSVFAICFGFNLIDFVMRLLIIEKKNTLADQSAPQQEDTEKGSVDVVSKKGNLIVVTVQTVDSDSDTDSTCRAIKSTIFSSLRSKSVIIDLLFSSRMMAALYGAFLYTTLQTAFDATLPLFTEETFAWNSLGGGLIFLPLLLSDFCGPIFGWLSDRFGARLTCTVGLLIGTAPLVCLRFVEHNTIEHKILLCALLALIGLGMAAVLPAVMAEIGEVIEAKGLLKPNGTDDVSAVSRAYGLFNIAYSGGCLVGPLWGGLIRESAGWGSMGWSLAILWASGLVPILLWL